MDILENYDRIVDYETDGEHDTEQSQHVDGVVERVNRHETGDHGNRNGHRRNDGGAKRAEKAVDHDQH